MELSYAVILIILVALAVRFPERDERRGQFHCHGGCHACAPAAVGGGVGGLFQFCRRLFFGTAIAKTIGRGIVAPGVVDNPFVLSALLGAVGWVWLCTHYGLPISVSHSLIGGMVGAALLKGGWQGVVWWPGVGKIAIFIVLSPLIGFVLGYLLMGASLACARRGSYSRMTVLFRGLQLVSSASLQLGSWFERRSKGGRSDCGFVGGEQLPGAWRRNPVLGLGPLLRGHRAGNLVWRMAGNSDLGGKDGQTAARWADSKPKPAGP